MKTIKRFDPDTRTVITENVDDCEQEFRAASWTDQLKMFRSLRNEVKRLEADRDFYRALARVAAERMYIESSI